MQRFTSPFFSEQEQWVLWLPVCFAVGILLYFSLSSEPPLWPAALMLACAFTSAIGFRKYLLPLSISLVLLFGSAGFFTASLRSLRLAAPVITHETGIIRIEARVAAIFPLASGKRILFDQLISPALPAYATPVKIRLIVRTKSTNIQIGDRVSFRASLSPPPPPVLPGGYDFARSAYFQQIGAIGYTVTALKVLSQPTSPTIAQRFYNFRMNMAAHIISTMGTRTGAIANALMLGVDSAIDKTILGEMRASGLSHILSVSGMHLSLVAALFFFLVRFLLVLLCEPLALRFDIKKLAALIALTATFGYYLISGMQVAAFRSFLMTGLVILAIFLNRTSTPLRSVAWAAFIILSIQPEAIMDPSFQMSFAAILALFATYTLNRNTLDFFMEQGFSGHIVTYIAGVAFSSLIASLATAPFAMYHFNQYANYSILANVIAVPLTSFMVMPLAVLAFFLYPLGLDGWVLTLMRFGIEWFIAISHHVALLPFAVTLMPFMPPLSLLLAVLGGLWLCLWHNLHLRLLGLLPIMLAAALMLTAPKPDIMIDGKGSLFAVRNQAGELMVSSRQHGRYARTMWLKQNGQSDALNFMKEEQEDTTPPINCDENSCLYHSNNNQIALFAFTVSGLQQACLTHPAILLNLTAEEAPCPAPTYLTLHDLHQNGTHVLFLEKNSVRIITVEETRGRRLWNGFYN